MNREDVLRIARATDVRAYRGEGSVKALIAFANQIEAEAIAKAANQVPTNWLDPLLSGDDAAVKFLPAPGPNIEALLRAVKVRIMDLSTQEPAR
jgi:hypothetical protein